MRPSLFFVLIPLFVILTALLILLISNRAKRRMGLPPGEIIYADAEKWGRVAKPLYDSALALTGKPDYLIRKDRFTIPVEVKSNWAPSTPYDSHVMQLAAYCLLVERTSGVRPPYGLLRYRNRTFKIRYSEALESSLLETISSIRFEKDSQDVARSHNQPRRCSRCGYRHICSQRI